MSDLFIFLLSVYILCLVALLFLVCTSFYITTYELLRVQIGLHK